MAQFLEHWELVDPHGPGGELVIANAVVRAGLEGLRDNLETARDRVTDAAVDRALAREDLNTKAAALQVRMVEFNGRVRADLPGHAFERVLPLAFAVGDGEAAVRDGLRHMSAVWTRINALGTPPPGLTLPLVLREGFTLTNLNAARDALRDAYRALSEAEVDLSLAREERNDLQDAIYVVLKNYRLKVPQTLPLGHALVESMPALTPPDGHTPSPVTAAVVWDVPAGEAKVTWGESSDPNLAEYQVRGVPGDDYTADDEVVVATVPAGGAREVLTLFALGSPGQTAGFKVYVVLTMGNERGSEPRYVTRPA